VTALRWAARLFLIIVAGTTFLGAALVSGAPQVEDPGVPSARDVGTGRTVARLAFAAMRNNGAGYIGIRAEELPGVARVISFSNPSLTVDGRIEAGPAEKGSVRDGRHQVPHTATARAAIQIAERTWLNATLSGQGNSFTQPGRIAAKLGTVQLSPGLTEAFADLAIRFVWGDQPGPAPTLDTVIPGLRVGGDFVTARIDMPVTLIRQVQALIGRYPEDAVDAARASYLRLTRFEDSFRRPATMAGLFRAAFPDSSETVTPGASSGRLVAMLMASYDPTFLRFLDASAGRTPLCLPEPFIVTVAGRRDLALHFLISAVFSANRDSDLGDALGEMKELSDALPGGSGFSFVDLAADRAGLRLGQLLADPNLTAETQARLSRARPGDLFPARALGLEEGLSEAEFERRFGALDSAQYEAAVERIDRALDALPIYAPLLR
jgi:uncharacterized protein YfiM (DUF2279 family)